MNEEAKPRKQMGPIELYSEDAGVLTKLALQPPQDLRSSDALKRWLRGVAEIDGRYVFIRRLAAVDLKIGSVRQVAVTDA